MSGNKRALTLAAIVAALSATAMTVPAADAAAGKQEFIGNSLAGNYLAGRFAGKQRDNGTAATFFRQALKTDPNNPVLIERAFVLELSSGDMASAEIHADQLLQHSRQHRMAHLVLGLRDMRRKKPDLARRHFKRAAFTPVGELTSALLIAWSYASEGNLAEALSALNALDRNESFRNFKSFHAALIADYLGSPSRAEAFYKASYENAGNSLRVVQAYGNYLARTKRRKQALEVFGKYLKRTSDSALVLRAKADLEAGRKLKKFVPNAARGTAEALFSVASVLSDEQSIDVSLIYTQLALSVRPDLYVARTLLGEIYEDFKQYDKAIEAFEQIEKTSPLYDNAAIKMASNLDNLDKTDEALKRLDALLKTDPRNYTAWLTRSNIQRARERWVEAAKSYTKVLEFAPKPRSEQWTVLYFRGIAYERSKQWPKAEADFLEALKFRPEEPALLNYLGYSWVEKGMHLKRALGMVQKAVELKPNDGYIVDSLGWAYFQLKDYDKAVKHLERAVDLKPADPTLNEHLGDAYWRVGRKLEAKFQWQHALDSKPDKENIERIRTKLKNGLPDSAVKEPAVDDKSPKKS